MNNTIPEARLHVGNAMVPSVRIWPERIDPRGVADHKTYLILMAQALGAMARGACDYVAVCALYRGAAVWELYLADRFQAKGGRDDECMRAELGAMSCAMMASDWHLVRRVLDLVPTMPSAWAREAREAIEREANEREAVWTRSVADLAMTVRRANPATRQEAIQHALSVGASCGAPSQVAWAMSEECDPEDRDFVMRWRAMRAVAEPFSPAHAERLIQPVPAILRVLAHDPPAAEVVPRIALAVADAWIPTEAECRALLPERASHPRSTATGV